MPEEFKNVWSNITDDEKDLIFKYNEGYIGFLNQVKTEREFVDYAVPILIRNGYKDIEEYFSKGGKLKPGDRVFQNIHGKSLILAVIGSEKCENGFNIIGSHVDSPRLDFKQKPIYEENDTVYAKTHYYGGIKKYQWFSVPLALHGVVITKTGETVKIVIGEDEKDPCFIITDLLPHLANEQMKKTLAEAFPGENLNIILGSVKSGNENKGENSNENEEVKTEANADKNVLKSNILSIIKNKYGIEEDDFISSEIEAVPAYKARDIGLDRGIVGAYGQDDRVCAYASLSAILDTEPENIKKTAIVYFSDKEEVGSMGNTGARSKSLENFIFYICSLSSPDYSDFILRRCISASHMLSADVTAAVDANYDVQDKKNSSYFGRGVVIEKYTGSKGKSSANDANPEFIALLRNIFDSNNIFWQTGEIGKVDMGGGGTIAQFMANLGMQVVDCGVPVLGMHSPFELVSKADVYYTYKAYHAFYKT